MSAITTTIEMNRPPEDMFAYVTNPARFAAWQHGVLNGHMDGDGQQMVGARCLTTRKIGGSERSATSEITHIDPPNPWGVRGSTARSGRSST